MLPAPAQAAQLRLTIEDLRLDQRRMMVLLVRRCTCLCPARNSATSAASLDACRRRAGERCAALRWRSVHVQKPTTLAARHLCQPASCSSKRVSVGCPTRPSTPCLLPTRPSTPPHPTIPAPQAVLVEEQAQALQQGLAQRGQQAQQGADLLGAALEVVQQLHAAGPVSVRGCLLEEAR